MRLCFGEVFGVGLPKRSGRPSRTNPTTYAHRGDNVNILHLFDDDDVMDDGEDIFRERTADRGIDFYYDEAAGTLRLRIRYSSLVISDEVVLLLETIAMPEHNSILRKWGKLSSTSFFLRQADG